VGPLGQGEARLSGPFHSGKRVEDQGGVPVRAPSVVVPPGNLDDHRIHVPHLEQPGPHFGVTRPELGQFLRCDLVEGNRAAVVEHGPVSLRELGEQHVQADVVEEPGEPGLRDAATHELLYAVADLDGTSVELLDLAGLLGGDVAGELTEQDDALDRVGTEPGDGVLETRCGVPEPVEGRVCGAHDGGGQGQIRPDLVGDDTRPGTGQNGLLYPGEQCRLALRKMERVEQPLHRDVPELGGADDQPVDRRQQGLAAARHRQEVVAQGGGPPGEIVVALGRQDDPQHAGMVGTDVFEQIDAVQPGHLQVGDDHVVVVGVEQTDRLVGGRGDVGRPPRNAVRHLAEIGQDLQLVVDEQQACAFVRHRLSRRLRRRRPDHLVSDVDHGHATPPVPESPSAKGRGDSDLNGPDKTRSRLPGWIGTP
jgi:hypothetical protein